MAHNTARWERHTALQRDKGIIYNVFVDGLMEKLGGDQYRAQITYIYSMGVRLQNLLRAESCSWKWFISSAFRCNMEGKVSNGSREWSAANWKLTGKFASQKIINQNKFLRKGKSGKHDSMCTTVQISFKEYINISPHRLKVENGWDSSLNNF
jgi:hypothetical protein